MSDPIGSVTVREDGGFVVAAVAGEVDLSNAAEFQALVEAGVANAHLGLVIDLRRTDYLDSAALTVLFRLLRATRARNQVLRLVLPRDSRIRRVIDLTELPGLVEIYEESEPALKAPIDGSPL